MADDTSLGAALRAARLWRGWSRETLAHHSGLSWAAITQIESGRRREVRVSSLVALSQALDVSLDYLVGGDGEHRLLNHSALVYHSEHELAEFAETFLGDGIREAHALLVVTPRAQLRSIRKALGKGADSVELRESVEWYSSPADAAKRFRSFVRDARSRGAGWIRVMGEPIWEGRSSKEIAAWTRYESLLNITFAFLPVDLVCPYDARSVPDRVIANAHRTHPEFAVRRGTEMNKEFEEPEQFICATD
jgi:transcriptional regulator with XRE-family HTH domain